MIPTDSRFYRSQYPTSIHPRNWIGEPYLTGGEAHRILIIDDEAEVRHILVDLLSGFGHDAEATGNPREAFTMLAERTYALILTDLHMTQMAGEVLYQNIAQRWPHLASRVVFVTGEVPLPMVVSLFGAGHVPILRKPFTRDELWRLVERMLT